jgi:hypothetical protein
MENGKWQMIFAFWGGLAFSEKRTNRFEGFTVFKPPALPKDSDLQNNGVIVILHCNFTAM